MRDAKDSVLAFKNGNCCGAGIQKLTTPKDLDVTDNVWSLNSAIISETD